MSADIIRRWLLLSTMLPLGACTQWYYQFGETLPTGYESRAEGMPMSRVLAELGPPMRYARGPDGWMMAWEAWRIRETSIGISLGLVGIEALELDWGEARIEGDFLLLTFDEARRVDAATRGRRDNDVGGGAAVQPLSGFVSVVEIDDLLYPLPQHRWGAAQLRTLPEVLNNGERPGMGDTGLEQRGTPRGAGQRSSAWQD